MNPPLLDRIVRKIETLPDERAYQILDYVEFLESKYAERQSPAGNVFTRFAETVEDKLRAGKVSASTIAETMGLMNKAMNVLGGVAAAGKSVASDLVGAATRTVQGSGSEGTHPATTPAGGSPAGASSGSQPAAAPPPPAGGAPANQPAASPPPPSTSTPPSSPR
jgi:hypothetical protein